MNRRFRLTRSTDFQRVRRLGKSYTHPLMVLVAFPSQGEISRFGVAAGKTVGKAVRRNRAKRLLRNALLPLLPVVKSGWDVVIIARRPMVEADLEQTQSALSTLLYRARLIDEIHNV